MECHEARNCFPCEAITNECFDELRTKNIELIEQIAGLRLFIACDYKGTFANLRMSIDKNYYR